jgi:hypothetical protein
MAEGKKCICTSPSHKHPNNKCQKDVTDPEDSYCRDCYKKASDEWSKTNPEPTYQRHRGGG